MIKNLWRLLATMCYVVGAKRLAFRFGIMSLETVNVSATVIPMHNEPSHDILNGDFDMRVVWEDKELLEELGSRRTNDVKIPRRIVDIN